MKEKTSKTLLRRALLIVLMAAACLLNTVPAFATDGMDGAGTGRHYENEQWNLDMIHAEGAFAKGALGQGIRVGVLDSGINPHADFGDRLLPGHNYMEDAADENDTSDSLGHGTGVAGLIAGANERGYIGTAPGAMLVPLKVTDGKEVSISAVCRAIYSGVDDYGCNVLNLSLGIEEEYEELREAIDYATGKGVIVVAATGNDGTNTVYYPAGYDSVIGVGAVNQDGTSYYHSVHNSSVCVTAPGVRVRSTGNDGEYTYCTGTSFAVPQVAGAVAVLLGLNPTLTQEQIAALLSNTATDRGEAGYDEYFGYGILNLTGCVEALTGETITAPEEPSEQAPTVIQPEIKTDYRSCLRDDSCMMSAYSDLYRESWYHDGVHFVLENHIMNGVGDQSFDPNGPTSRAMLVTTLWRMEGEPRSDYAMGFADVQDGAWYTEAVRWAAANSIVGGYSAEQFGPNDSVSREQLATILWRYAAYIGADTSAGEAFNLGIFLDAEYISGWAWNAMRWAAGAGLINGVGNERISPETNASRAQVATILMRYRENI